MKQMNPMWSGLRRPLRRGGVFIPLSLAAMVAVALVASVLVLSTSPNTASAASKPPGNSSQIVNGQPADPGEYPAQGFLEFDTSAGTFECGGTLVDTIHFLTAGHCATDENTGDVVPPQDFRVFLGEVDRNNFGPQNEYGVSLVDRNENFDPSTYDYDVAMLTLSEPANFTPTRVVEASETYLWEPGVWARIIGWGTIFSGGPDSAVLLKADAPMDSDQECSHSYGTGFDPQAMVCAGDGATDTCQGDSGGPLLVPDRARPGNFALAGVVSKGNGCADPNFPGIYARVGSEPLNSWVHARISPPGNPPPPPPPPPSVALPPSSGSIGSGGGHHKGHHHGGGHHKGHHKGHH